MGHSARDALCPAAIIVRLSVSSEPPLICGHRHSGCSRNSRFRSPSASSMIALVRCHLRYPCDRPSGNRTGIPATMLKTGRSPTRPSWVFERDKQPSAHENEKLPLERPQRVGGSSGPTQGCMALERRSCVEMAGVILPPVTGACRPCCVMFEWRDQKWVASETSTLRGAPM